MSRTNAHKPITARIVTEAVENHDHRDGPCDLPPLHEYIQFRRSQPFMRTLRRWRCSYDIDWTKTAPVCGCRMCTGYWYNLWERRRERHRMKTLLKKSPYDA